MKWWSSRFLGQQGECTASSLPRTSEEHFGLFRDLLGRVPWYKALEGRGAQESWLKFKNHLLQAQV